MIASGIGIYRATLTRGIRIAVEAVSTVMTRATMTPDVSILRGRYRGTSERRREKALPDQRRDERTQGPE